MRTHTHTHLIICSPLSLKRSHTLKHTFTLTKREKNKTQDDKSENYTDNRSHYFKRGFSTAQGDGNAHILAGNNVTLRFVWAVTQCRILSLHGGILAYPGFI